MLSLFKPLRRYGCANHLCAHEVILWKRAALTQRPIVAAASLVGAAVAGALVAGLGLYLVSDASTRASVRGAYADVMQPDAATRPDTTLALPESTDVPEPRYETASMLETSSDTGDVQSRFLPPLPTLAPAANALTPPTPPR
jgi:hypothetical protein